MAPFEAEGLDWFAGMGEANIEEFGLMSQGREHALAALDEERQVMLGAAPSELFDGVASLLSDVDRQAMADDELARWLAVSCAEGFRDSAEGWVDDDIAFTSPWGFDVGDVTGDIRIWQGEQDRFVPAAHARWLAAHIPARGSSSARSTATCRCSPRPAGRRSWRRYRARRSAAATTSSSRSRTVPGQRAAGLDADRDS